MIKTLTGGFHVSKNSLPKKKVYTCVKAKYSKARVLEKSRECVTLLVGNIAKSKDSLLSTWPPHL